jgi:hypothetical protein
MAKKTVPGQSTDSDDQPGRFLYLPTPEDLSLGPNGSLFWISRHAKLRHIESLLFDF